MMKNINKIFSSTCNFIIGAAEVHDIPASNIPEVAFIGRSNVGKSSLINVLVNRVNLSRISQTPGRTKQINFFNLGDFLYLVDLPGYGYAKISKSERKSWDKLIYSYLKGSTNLKRVFLLIDARCEIKSSDLQTMKFLDDCAVSYQLVLTKSDKIKETLLENVILQLKSIGAKHAACHPEIIFTSSKSKIGIDKLREAISEFVL
jgi:GTP-binding protein